MIAYNITYMDVAIENMLPEFVEGDSVRAKNAKSPPAIPMKKHMTVKTNSFWACTFIPIASDRSPDSLIASHTMPIRLFSIKYNTASEIATIARVK